MNSIARKERNDRDIENKFDLKQLELLKIEEDQFQKYAQKIINHAQKNERNTYPLKVNITLFIIFFGSSLRGLSDVKIT